MLTAKTTLSSAAANW